LSSNLYSLKIAPNVRSFYGVPTSETIEKLAFVFRSAAEVNGSYLEGKTADFSDIFVDIHTGGLNVYLQKPSSGYIFASAGDTIPLELHAVDADSVFLFQNNTLIKADSGNFLLDTIYAPATGKYWINGHAQNATQQKADSFFYLIHTAPDTLALPAGIQEGINYHDGQSLTLCLFAPYQEFVYALGDFNNWEPDTQYNMHITPDGKHYWVKINNLIPSKEYVYQYLVNGELALGDPYAEKVSDPWNDSYISAQTYPGILDYPTGKANGIATVFQTNQTPYVWKNNSYIVPENEDLIVYELLIRDFHQDHSFQSVIDSLAYLKNLGINAIELMPVNEFEGNISWGYNPNYYFAVDKYYGPAEKLMELIDTCHSLGIAIILDVVYNHSFGSAPYVRMWWDKNNSRPSFNNPFFNPIAKHDFNVGYDMNHESMETKKYIGRALRFWLEKYKVDGFRFDLSKGFTQNNTLGNSSAMANYDASRIAILSAYADTVWSVNPNAYVILEHFANNDEEMEFSSRGMMLWGNLNHNYSEGAMGYNGGNKSDFSSVIAKNRGWSEKHLVGYMESHDEERAMYKCKMYGNSSGAYSTKQLETYMQRASMNAVFFLTTPGPKMIWQFGELGYDISIDENGRTGLKPILWNYASNPNRWNNYLIYSYLNALRLEEKAVFQSDDFTSNFTGNIKTLHLRDTSANVVIIGNYDVVEQEYSLSFPHDGTWYDLLSGTSIEVSDLSLDMKLSAGEYHLFMDIQKPKPDLEIPIPGPKPPIDFEGSMHVYPNPSSDQVSIYLNSSETGDIYIYDLQGKEVGHYTFNTAPVEQVIDLNDIRLHLKTGTYVCKWISSSTTEVQKFIIL
jgi:glycosidase